jgi:flagellar basal-body rod protein FlgB
MRQSGGSAAFVSLVQDSVTIMIRTREADAVSDLYIMRVASENAQWLSEKQSLIASNIANANTPGYRARDLTPFAVTRTSAEVGMAVTNKAHMTTGGAVGSSLRATEQKSWEETLSGNSVNVEQQLIDLGNVGRSYQLNLNVKHAIHQMLATVLK